MTVQNRSICPWVTASDKVYLDYHDQEWGKPVFDSVELFEKLCLDGQQAGLSWITILKKKHGYHDAFFKFDPYKIITLTEMDVLNLLDNPNIIRNKLKVNSIIKNAKGYIAMEKEGINFSEFLWSFVGGEPIQNNYVTSEEVPTQNHQSLAMSKALKKRGFTFVGPTICYAFMEAVGMFNNHLLSCDIHKECC